MNDQLDIWRHVRSTDPQTSRDAFLSVDLNKRCREVLVGILDGFGYAGTFTDGLLADFLSDDRNIVARRRKDLLDLGLVEPVYRDGQQERMTGRRGRDELVWMLTPSGADRATVLRLEVA